MLLMPPKVSLSMPIARKPFPTVMVPRFVMVTESPNTTMPVASLPPMILPLIVLVIVAVIAEEDDAGS